MVQAFTKASASVDGTRSGRFCLLDGNVLGVFTELVRKVHFWKEKIVQHSTGCSTHQVRWTHFEKVLSTQVSDEKIVMKWRYNNWPSGE